MAELIRIGRVLEVENDLHLDIQDIEAIQTDSGTLLVAAGGYNGGLISLSVAGDGTVTLLASAAYGPGQGSVGHSGLSLVETGQGLVVVTGVGTGNALQGGLVNTQTGQFTASTLTAAGGIDSPVVIRIGDFLYAASAGGGLSWHSATGANRFSAGSVLEDDAAAYLDDVIALAQVQGRAGRDILLTLSRGDDGVSAFALDPTTGTPRVVETLAMTRLREGPAMTLCLVAWATTSWRGATAKTFWRAGNLPRTGP